MRCGSHVCLTFAGVLAAIAISPGLVRAGGEKPRARELGIPLEGVPGPLNAITDVPGVEVGHATIIRGEGPLKVGKGPVRTGVTAILPRGKTFDPVFAARYVLNGNGELTGTTWIDESGFLETPILITNTFSVGVVRDAALAWMEWRNYKSPVLRVGNSDIWMAYPGLDRPALLRHGPGDRGGDPECHGRRRDDDRGGWHHRPCPAARSPAASAPQVQPARGDAQAPQVG